MATGRIGVTPTLGVRWSKAPASGTTSLSGLDDSSVSLVYSVGYEQVYRNGVLLSRGNDYTATTGTTVTLTEATIAGDLIEIFAQQLVPLTDAISKGQFTAKGALLSATAASTPGVLAVGANDTVLTADSTTSTGLKWATPASGSFTLISTASPSAVSTFEFTSIPATYKQLFLVGNLRPSADGNGQNYLEFNSDTGSNYYYTASGSSGAASLAPFASSSNQVHNNLDNGKDFSIYQSYRNYTATTPKIIESAILGWQYDNAAQINTTYIQRLYSYTGTSAISSIKFYAVTGTYTGTVSLYGQN